MSVSSPTNLQREALLRLMETVGRTVERERELTRALDDATRDADARLAHIRKTAAAKLEVARSNAQSTWERLSTQIEDESAQRLLGLENDWKASIASTEEKAERRRSDANKARQEAIWLAETVFEATSNQPTDQLDQTRKGLVGFRHELERVEKDAAAWAKSCRQKPAAPPEAIVDGPGEADLAAAQAAGTLPSKPGLEHATEEARELLAAMRKLVAPRLFHSGLPMVLLLLPPAIAAVVIGLRLGWQVGGANAGTFWGTIAGVAVLTVLALFALRALAGRQFRAKHEPLLAAVAAGNRAATRCEGEAEALCELQLAELARRRDSDVEKAHAAHGPMLAAIEERRVVRLAEVESTFPTKIESTTRDRVARLAKAQTSRDAALADAERSFAATIRAAEEEHHAGTAGAREAFAKEWDALRSAWRRETTRCQSELDEVRAVVAARFPAWGSAAWNDWSPPKEFPGAIPFGSIKVDLAQLPSGLPQHADLALPGPAAFEVPALLDFPEQASLLVEAAGAGLEAAVPALQAIMFRLLTAAPPGKVRFTILDPVGLGQNFAGFMHLADDDGALVTDRIWTEDRHIDQRLLDITEHMENVIQKYLRNEYQTIGQYNVDAGEIAEPYRFLVVANLPVNFSESAARRLNSVVASGPRCGVFTLVTADVRAPRPPGLQLDDLARASTTLRQPGAAPPTIADSKSARNGQGGTKAATVSPPPPEASDPRPFVLDHPAYAPWALVLEASPPEALLTRVLRVVGREAKSASRVEVPFQSVAPPGTTAQTGAESERAVGDVAATASSLPESWWSASSTSDLRIGLGRAGATKIQQLMLGQGVSQHVLIAGKTGSGKSTLLHALITNTAMWFSPGEVEFYLIDFKKGVEFKTYASNDLAHARVVAIESDREFGLSVLQRLDAELRRRGELYRELGVQDLAGFRRESAARKGAGVAASELPPNLPRTLLVIDEFQEFFTEDDKISQDATLLLDRLVRQGRAFGIHVILGSQTLGGAYSLARATIGQMAVRIALQCSEADSYLILADDNAAARLLARPGEAIYNDQGGLVEGNNPFQIAWLGEELRDRYLAGVRALAARRGVRRAEPMIVFEGNVPAELPRNPLLAALVAPGAAERAAASARAVEPRVRADGRAGAAIVAPPQAWLGEAIAIKDPTAAVFRRQSGANLIVVGQRDDAAVGMLFAGALGLLAQRPDARVYLFDALPPDSPEAGQLGRLATLLPGAATSVAWRDVATTINEVHAELERRQNEEGPDAPPIFLVFAGLHRFRMLRQEDDFGFSGSSDPDAPPKPDKQFGTIAREGPVFGVHTLAWVDTVNNLNRTLDRQAMKEFEQRVLFQMGQSDSSTLIDSPAAAKLGLHRAIYFSEESGVMEKFRPYAAPPQEWLEGVAAAIRDRVPAARD